MSIYHKNEAESDVQIFIFVPMQFYDRLNILLIRFRGRLVAFISFDVGHIFF